MSDEDRQAVAGPVVGYVVTAVALLILLLG